MIEVEGTVYTLGAGTVLRNELGVIELSGASNIDGNLTKDVTQVFDIVANDANLISSMKYRASTADKAAAKTVIDAINALATSTDLATDVLAARALYGTPGTSTGTATDSVVRQNLVPASVAAKLVAEETKLANADAVTDVADDKAALTITGDLANVTANLTLAIAGTSTNTTITWVSSDTDVVEDSVTGTLGDVNRPTFTEGDATVTLTATITSDNVATVKDTKTFTVTVKAAAITPTEEIQLDKAALEIGYTAGDSRTNVTDDLTLATSGSNGTTIAWASSNTAIVDTDGTVVRPAGADTEITLTATITKASGTTATKVFIVTVKGN